MQNSSIPKKLDYSKIVEEKSIYNLVSENVIPNMREFTVNEKKNFDILNEE